MDILAYVIEKGGTGKPGCPVIAATAEQAECSPATLYMIALGHKQASAKLAKALSRATNWEVGAHELRPDIFGDGPEDAPAANDPDAGRVGPPVETA